MTRPTRPRPTWPHDPPLEPFQVTLARVNRQLQAFNHGHRGDPKESLRQLVTSDPLDLDGQAVGSAEHLLTAHLNTFKAADLLRSMAGWIEKEGLTVNARAMAAGGNLLAAAQMVDTALLMHLRAKRWYVNSTLILLRTALELAVRGGAIALGSEDEASRFEHGPDLPTREERRAAEFNTTMCCGVVLQELRRRQPGLSEPVDVYRWLCRFTHFDANRFKHPAEHAQAYAALAYVGWVSTALTEVVLGIPNVAVWPTVWPSPLPWSSGAVRLGSTS